MYTCLSWAFGGLSQLNEKGPPVSSLHAGSATRIKEGCGFECRQAATNHPPKGPVALQRNFFHEQH